MSAEESKAVVERFFRAMTEGDEAALDQLVAPDAEIVGALGGGRPLNVKSGMSPEVAGGRRRVRRVVGHPAIRADVSRRRQGHA
jgi:ketosteroid isomerase-like protein